MQNTTISRREFMLDAAKVAAATVAITEVLGFTAEASSTKPPLPMQPVTLDLSKSEYASLANMGGTLKIPNPHDKKRPIIVTRTSDTSVTAFSSKCTHFGCEVELPQNNVAICPCHGSKYDMTTGQPTHGPAKKNLSSFTAMLDNNTITIQDAT